MMRHAITVAALVLAAQLVGAQETSPDTSNVCFGFRFGAFTPALDRVAAGHPALADSVLQRAPGGRDWASDLGRSSDTTLVLFPGWWPAGVIVEFARRPVSRADTVDGVARAFVANGQLTPPKALVRLWRVNCGRS
jgi:hypothetical protein